MLKQQLKGLGDDLGLLALLVAVGGGIGWFLVWRGQKMVDEMVDSVVSEDVQEAVSDVVDEIPDSVKQHAEDLMRYGLFGYFVTGYRLGSEYSESFLEWLTTVGDAEDDNLSVFDESAV
jgi:hypothetical protein